MPLEPPENSRRDTERMTVRMISDAAMVTMAR